MVNLRAAIVGCGRIASTDHAAAHTADPRVHLVAVVDPDHDRARALARRSGVREVFTSLEEMLATTDVHLVTLCAPPHLNAPLATTALRAGCHVLCDQPAATDSTDLARLAETATAHHRVLTFASPYRHLPEAQMTRALVDAGEIGEIHDVQLAGSHSREASSRGRHWEGDEVGGGSLDRPLADGAPPAPYRACAPLPDIGIHLLDLAMWITGFSVCHPTMRARRGIGGGRATYRSTRPPQPSPSARRHCDPNLSLTAWYTPSASLPSRGPASQPALTGPMEVLDTSAGAPSEPVATQPPPDEPPVMVHPMRYIVGSDSTSENRPGLSVHWYIVSPSYGAPAG